MKKWKLCLINLFLIPHLAFAAPAELDQVVAVVNDGVILKSDVDSMHRTVEKNALSQGQTLPPEKELNNQIVERLITEELQYQQAEKMGIRIDDPRLDQAISKVAKDNGESVEALRQSVMKEGTSWATYREQLRKEIAIAEARNANVRRRINILPQEVDTLAAQLNKKNQAQVQYHIEHIQLALSDDADATERKAVANEAEDLVNQLKNGANFASLALRYSKGPKAFQGGDWGWMRLEEMPTIFADQIGGHGNGAVIGPFRSGVGYHILKIAGVKGLETVAVTETNARHILIKPSIILSDDMAKKELEGMVKDIKSGRKSFADLAKQYSQDPGSAANGGELGWQTSDIYVPEFKEQVDTLPVGQISEPFKTVHGWHIVEVEGRRQVDRTDAAVKNRAYNLLFRRKFNEEAQAWLQELRAGAYVEMMGEDNSAR